jgi:hypothetical protein
MRIHLNAAERGASQLGQAIKINCVPHDILGFSKVRLGIFDGVGHKLIHDHT